MIICRDYAVIPRYEANFETGCREDSGSDSQCVRRRFRDNSAKTNRGCLFTAGEVPPRSQRNCQCGIPVVSS